MIENVEFVLIILRNVLYHVIPVVLGVMRMDLAKSVKLDNIWIKLIKFVKIVIINAKFAIKMIKINVYLAKIPILLD